MSITCCPPLTTITQEEPDLLGVEELVAAQFCFPYLTCATVVSMGLPDNPCTQSGLSEKRILPFSF